MCYLIMKLETKKQMFMYLKVLNFSNELKTILRDFQPINECIISSVGRLEDSDVSFLKTQLNPHFLYNIFNTISASVPAENEHTRHMIAELSDLFRYQLKASQVEKVPLRDELAFVKKYLALEKERFQERLEVELDVEEQILNEMIPPMLLQPLVENSVKHGLSSLIVGGKITISIKKKAGKLFFEIADTGIGIKDKSKAFNKGIGLTNTRMRLEKMYQSTLQLNDNTPNGLKISFAI